MNRKSRRSSSSKRSDLLVPAVLVLLVLALIVTLVLVLLSILGIIPA